MEWEMKISPQTSRPGSRMFTTGYLEYYIAGLPGVQRTIEDYTFRIATRAEEDLRQHSLSNPANTGDSYIDIDKDLLDGIIELNDFRGQGAAMSIEYGHGAYDVYDKKTGQKLYHVRASAPTWILHRAANLPRKIRKVKLPRKVVR